jgi:hypothetical protein
VWAASAVWFALAHPAMGAEAASGAAAPDLVGHLERAQDGTPAAIFVTGPAGRRRDGPQGTEGADGAADVHRRRPA